MVVCTRASGFPQKVDDYAGQLPDACRIAIEEQS